MNIGFIGLGKLGLVCAETFADFFNVYGFDVCNKEPLLNKVKWSTSIADVVEKCEIVFISVQTPHKAEYGGTTPTSGLPPKDFDYSFINNVISEIDNCRLDDQLIVLISTVLPGTIRSKLKLTDKIRDNFIYNPYLIAMGTETRDLKDPEMLILGNSSGIENEQMIKLKNVYKKLMGKDCFTMLGTWEDAEATKVFYNTFISTKIALVNMIQDVANKLDNLNCDKVAQAIAKSTKRIMSNMYMKPGMGDGGPCHPRDNIALSFLASELGLGYDLFGSIMHTREQQAKNLANFILLYGKDVCILGKSFKPGTRLDDGSSSLLVAYYLKEAGAKVSFEINHDFSSRMVFLVAHRNSFYDYEFPENSILIDPWREYPKREGIEVIGYGGQCVL